MNIPYGIEGPGFKGYIKKTGIDTEKNKQKMETKNGISSEAQDSITISEEGEILQQARNEASNTRIYREEKIHSLKTAFENETYIVDSKKVASKLLREIMLEQLAE